MGLRALRRNLLRIMAWPGRNRHAFQSRRHLWRDPDGLRPPILRHPAMDSRRVGLENCDSLQHPAFAILFADEAVRFWRVLRFQVHRVPLQLLADAIGDVAEMIGLGE